MSKTKLQKFKSSKLLLEELDKQAGLRYQLLQNAYTKAGIIMAFLGIFIFKVIETVMTLGELSYDIGGKDIILRVFYVLAILSTLTFLGIALWKFLCVLVPKTINVFDPNDLTYEIAEGEQDENAFFLMERLKQTITNIDNVLETKDNQFKCGILNIKMAIITYSITIVINIFS